MNVLSKSRAEAGLWLEDKPLPAVGINDVLIRVLRTSICGTDVHIWNWDAWAQKTIPQGLTIGHEFVGARELRRAGHRDGSAPACPRRRLIPAGAAERDGGGGADS